LEDREKVKGKRIKVDKSLVFGFGAWALRVWPLAFYLYP